MVEQVIGKYKVVVQIKIGGVDVLMYGRAVRERSTRGLILTTWEVLGATSYSQPVTSLFLDPRNDKNDGRPQVPGLLLLG